ncbi:MAG: metallophosphoesterase [Candidatus Hodarchaeota archaeon]
MRRSNIKISEKVKDIFSRIKISDKAKKIILKILFYLGLIGTVLFPIGLSILLDEFWLTFTSVGWWLATIVVVVYILAMLYSIFLFFKYFFLMNRRPFGIKKVRNKFQTPAFLLLGTIITCFFVFLGPTWPRYDMHPHLSFTSDPATSITISWYSTTAYEGSVDYGTSPSNLNLSAGDLGSVNQHEITLTGLEPNTTYYYKIENFDDTWSFKTASNDTEILSIVAISDVHNQLYQPMVDDMVNEDPDFYLNAGDSADFGGWTYQWRDYFNQISPFATNYAIMSAVGNHDVFINGINNYYTYLAMPDDSGDERYYYFKYNGVHFIVLDLEWGTETYTAAQKAWFEAKLAQVPDQDWLIIMNHCQYFSSGGYGTQSPMVNTFHQLFVDNDVDLVITGHEHHFEILSVDNVTYAVIGNANSRLDHGDYPKDPNSIHYEKLLSGYSKITINGSECTIEGNLYSNGVLSTTRTYTFDKTW